MAFDVSALTDYTAPGLLIAKPIKDSTLSKYCDIIEGIKGTQYLNINYTTPYFTATACDRDPSGSTTVTQVTLSTYQFSYDENFCVGDFNSKSLGVNLKAGTSNGEDLAFVDQFMEEKTKAIKKHLSEIAWRGSRSTGSNDYARADGFLYQALHSTASASTIQATTAVTSANVVDTVNYIVSKFPSNILDKEDLVIFTTTANYILYIQALNALNLYHYVATFQKENTIPVFGFPNIMVVCDSALDGNSDSVDFYATWGKNMIWAVDATSETDRFDLLFNPYRKRIELSWATHNGFQVKFPEHVVVIK